MVRRKLREFRALFGFVRRCSATQNIDELVTALASGLADLIRLPDSRSSWSATARDSLCACSPARFSAS